MQIALSSLRPGHHPDAPAASRERDTLAHQSSDVHRIYLRVAVLPALLWAAALWYLTRLEGWGAWGAAAPVLIPVLALSAVLGLVGVALVWRAWRHGEPVRALVLATATASVVAMYYAVRGVA